MIYCMSDVHGDYARYQKMLQTIRFSDADTLYMLGDAIDRGPQSVEVVLDVMGRANVVFLRGNHEQMCLDDLHWRKTDARALWQMNGGGVTRRALLYKCAYDTRTKILSFFLSAPTCAGLEVNGRRFHLVHGFPSEDTHDQLWGRPAPDAEPPVPGATVILGHTPTPLLTGIEDAPARIWHGNGVVNIDCGCGWRAGFSRLACLRLDDMAEYYV
ncbi:MAG: metallophosphoesterase [Clostridia bacterium]|nr:metallophosphoesterase [Clostridia bacterium]